MHSEEHTPDWLRSSVADSLANRPAEWGGAGRGGARGGVVDGGGLGWQQAGGALRLLAV